jgi:hypothetical protein
MKNKAFSGKANTSKFSNSQNSATIVPNSCAGRQGRGNLSGEIPSLKGRPRAEAPGTAANGDCKF